MTWAALYDRAPAGVTEDDVSEALAERREETAGEDT